MLKVIWFIPIRYQLNSRLLYGIYKHSAKHQSLRFSRSGKLANCQLHKCHTSQRLLNPLSKEQADPEKLTKEMVALIWALKKWQARNANVTVKSLVKRKWTELLRSKSMELFKGYGYFQARKQGLLSERDCKLWSLYDKQMKRELAQNPDFFAKQVAFYLDGISFVHKRNPVAASVETKSSVKKEVRKSLIYSKRIKRFATWTSSASRGGYCPWNYIVLDDWQCPLDSQCGRNLKSQPPEGTSLYEGMTLNVHVCTMFKLKSFLFFFSRPA